MAIYVMRRYFGIGAIEMRHEIPAWEVDVLLEQFVVHETEGNEGDENGSPSGDPFARVPPELEALSG